jgi:imidazolonepropionase
VTLTAITGVGRLWTGEEPAVITDATVIIDGPAIAWRGPSDAVPTELRDQLADRTDVGGALVTPGLIDAHTHPVYLRPRLAETAARSEGLDYRDLGVDAGIAATVAALREAHPGEVEAVVRDRVRSWLAHGTTTIEAKTGYDLTRDGELEAVRLLASLRGDPRYPYVSVTFLAAHAVPPERADDPDAYVAEAASWAGAAADVGADSCDVFCDVGYFTVEQSRRVLSAAKEAGLIPRIHAEELEHTGGARLAAELGCASADHLLHVTDGDARALADAGVVATLCPTTALSMGRTPDVGALRRSGVELALGTDHNPGASGLTSMSTVVALAVSALGLSVPEALTAATSGAAAALRLDDRGRVAVGARADLVAWEEEHEGAFAWSWGLRPAQVWRAGAPVAALH